MKPTEEMIRRLKKDGRYDFPESLTRSESKTAAINLAKAATKDDRKNGITDSQFGIGINAFGYYFAAEING